MKKLIKGLLIALGALVALIVVAGVAVYVLSEMQIRRTYSIQAESVPIPTDQTSLERGRHLVSSVGQCSDCHGQGLGGGRVIDDPVIGRIFGPNLTRGSGGLGSALSDADFIRALRHGVGPDGKGLGIMPAEGLYYLTDADLGSIIQYVKSLPPVDNAVNQPQYGPLGRVLLVTGQIAPFSAQTIDHTAARPQAPPAGPTAEYGGYLVHIGNCAGCHGPGLSGGAVAGTPPGTPLAANITPTGIGTWSLADLTKALRTGTRPDGRVLDTFMPWPFLARLTDDEIAATYTYLKTVPPRPTGNH